MRNSFGQLFRITSFGESHSAGLGVVVDGCPAGLKLNLSSIQEALERRRPGQSAITTPRKEADAMEILSGLGPEDTTLGTPISIVIRNKNTRPADYSDLNQVFRPSHADFTTQTKYGIKAASGGGRSSARETASRVAAGAIAEQFLNHCYPDFKVVAYVSRVKSAEMTSHNPLTYDRKKVDEHICRCPDPIAAHNMLKVIEEARDAGDSVGGVITCVVSGVPVGLGEPVFDKLEAALANAMLSLPASKSFEIGSGLEGTYMFGSEHNDEFATDSEGAVITTTNRSGGVQGGISNGQPIVFRVGFKPVSTIFKKQKTVDTKGEEVEYSPNKGRHDPCVLPRAVPIVEAMAALVLADHALRLRTCKL